jgi:hypothetical protein
LAAQSEIIFIDAQEILMQERSRTTEHLYAKTDLHVLATGQLPIAKEIIARIARAEGRGDIHWNEKFQLAHAAVPGGSQAGFLATLTPPREEIPYYIGQYTIGGDEADGQWSIPDRSVFIGVDEGLNRPFDFAFHVRPVLCDERLPGLVLFGDSFSDLYWVLGLHRYFCFIQRARNPMDRFKRLYKEMPEGTKYFIYEYYLPHLPTNAPPLDF